MREVIRMPELTQANDKPVELTHAMTHSGWISFSDTNILNSESVVYLGRCDVDGDMFSVTDGRIICIFKGHLNSGKY